MKTKDVQLGQVYLTKVGTEFVRVRVTGTRDTMIGNGKWREKFIVQHENGGKRLQPRNASALRLVMS